MMKKFNLKFMFMILLFGMSYKYCFARHLYIQEDVQHYIDPKGVLYFNIDDNKGNIVAAQLDLNQFVPIIYPTHLTMTKLQFLNNQIRVMGYLRPNIIVDYSIDPENNQIINAVYNKEPPAPITQTSGYALKTSTKPVMQSIVDEMDLQPISDSGSVIINSKIISGEEIDRLEFILFQNSIEIFSQYMQRNQYIFNILMVLSSRNSFSDMQNFLDYTVSLLLENRDIDSFRRSKLLYFNYLQYYVGYDDFDLIISAINYDDWELIKRGTLNSINKISRSQFNLYSSNNCSALGYAIHMNKYAMIEILLDKDVNTNIVCRYTQEESSSALDIAEKQKNRSIIRIIKKHLSNQ